MLLILWNLMFNGPSKKSILALLAAFIVSGFIAGAILGPMYLTWKQFEFSRGYDEPYRFASNWANLIYKSWPLLQFNPLTKTPFWEYLKAHAKGEINIGMPFSLLLSALIIAFVRIKDSTASEKIRGMPQYLSFFITILGSSLIAFLNMNSLKTKSLQWELPPPELMPIVTYSCYIAIGVLIFIFHRRIGSAIKHLDFFLLLSALFFGLLMFGPSYPIGNKSIFASPIAFLVYFVPGFSAIRATARWGIVFSFTLSIAVALFTSERIISRKLKAYLSILMLMAILEVTPLFQIPNFKNLSPYQWSPRETDIFLKDLPGYDAVLELESYPVDIDYTVRSDNSLGYSLYSRLYHKKPLITGDASFFPSVIHRYIFNSEENLWSSKTVNRLRTFGAKYWVLHTDKWSSEEIRSMKNSTGALNLIAQLDNGKTLIYKDPEPKVSIVLLDKARNLILRGTKLMGNGNFNDAIVAFNKAKQFDPENAAIYWGLGTCISTKGQLNEALTLLNKAIEIDPTQGGFYENRAVVYAGKKDYARAWIDVHAANKLGRQLSPDFMIGLEHAAEQRSELPASQKDAKV